MRQRRQPRTGASYRNGRSPNTSGFILNLTPAFNSLDDVEYWALYKLVTSTTPDTITPVTLGNVTTSNDGVSYIFTATLTAGTYYLAYTGTDVVVVPRTTGQITVTVPVPR